MPFHIYQWSEIGPVLQPQSSILLGNGASIAVDQRFHYRSLLEYAQQYGLLSADVQRLFQFFGTDDFELILRIVWQATNVNSSLQIPDNRTRVAYLNVREALIRAVRAIHAEHDEVAAHIPPIYEFLKPFETVLSLNYDLIIYWAMMYGSDVPDRHSFKDCFIHGTFQDNWFDFREPIYGDTSTTLVFYPHGSLILARNKVEEELKLTRHDQDDLLESVLHAWETEQVVPLFVSEGTSEQKVNSIHGSYYLSRVHREVLQTIRNDLVIYGFGFWEHDRHILERLGASMIQRLFISVYEYDQAYCNRVHQVVREYFRPGVKIYFFDSNSPGCWNNVA